MGSTSDLVLQLRDVTQDYGGLRPLRVKAFDLPAGRAVALMGFDRIAAEVLVNLITGSSTPRTGDVRVFGTLTTDITSSDTWLRALEQFGLFGERTVLVEQLSVEQNLAIPITLDVEPMPPAVRGRVRALAEELELPAALLGRRLESLTPLELAQVRLGRALALAPRLLLAEHPSATLDAREAAALAKQMAGVVSRRAISALVLTADRAFAQQAGLDVLTLKPATGELVASVGWRRWLSG